MRGLDDTEGLIGLAGVQIVDLGSAPGVLGGDEEKTAAASAMDVEGELSVGFVEDDLVGLRVGAEDVAADLFGALGFVEGGVEKSAVVGGPV